MRPVIPALVTVAAVSLLSACSGTTSAPAMPENVDGLTEIVAGCPEDAGDLCVNQAPAQAGVVNAAALTLAQAFGVDEASGAIYTDEEYSVVYEAYVLPAEAPGLWAPDDVPEYGELNQFQPQQTLRRRGDVECLVFNQGAPVAPGEDVASDLLAVGSCQLVSDGLTVIVLPQFGATLSRAFDFTEALRDELES